MMAHHITYHPVSSDLLKAYPFYVFDEHGPALAREHCQAVGMEEANQQRFVDLLAHFAEPGDFPFDQTHGFSIALTQGFFGPYYYVNDGQLSALDHVMAPYTQTWQHAMEDFEASSSAHNRLLSRFSSGVFIPADKVASFMHDAHNEPALTQALMTQFHGEKLTVLWAALQTALDANAGLLEAAGAILPDATDPLATRCFTRLSNCDQAGLDLYASADVPDAAGSAMPPPPMPTGKSDLPLPPHLAENVAPNPGARLPSTPSLTEKLRQKREETG